MSEIKTLYRVTLGAFVEPRQILENICEVQATRVTPKSFVAAKTETLYIAGQRVFRQGTRVRYTDTRAEALLLLLNTAKATRNAYQLKARQWHEATETLYQELGNNPHFPALRSDPMAPSGASRRKQPPSSQKATS